MEHRRQITTREMFRLKVHSPSFPPLDPARFSFPYYYSQARETLRHCCRSKDSLHIDAYCRTHDIFVRLRRKNPSGTPSRMFPPQRYSSHRLTRWEISFDQFQFVEPPEHWWHPYNSLSDYGVSSNFDWQGCSARPVEGFKSRTLRPRGYFRRCAFAFPCGLRRSQLTKVILGHHLTKLLRGCGSCVS